MYLAQQATRKGTSRFLIAIVNVLQSIAIRNFSPHTHTRYCFNA